jgi:hypothetical protein
MANQIRKITLTELGADAGPNFSVQYSADCINYTQSVDGTDLFLPSVGSFAYCTIDSSAQCIRLTSLASECGNSIIEDISTPTTTLPIKYTYLMYNLNQSTCESLEGTTPIWSYNSYTDGYYKIESDPNTYYLQVFAHTDYTLQFTTATPTTCVGSTTTIPPTTLAPTTTVAPTTTISPTTLAPTTANLNWSFAELNGGNGTMDIYVNGSIVESRSITSTGTWTGLQVGDVIYAEINVTGCSGGNEYANAYTTGIIIDASCDLGVTFLSTATYTVVSGDLGTTLTLGMFATCDGGCV